ncbi:MAG: hypothetical protein GOP50_08590 [Candidatus Heimdallarchaeota archaeon]|nr:hypothetical protein [Candidatus Heimdallarchaeota archaeon]
MTVSKVKKTDYKEVIVYVSAIPVPINDAVPLVILWGSILLKWILTTVSLFVQKEK